MKSAGSERESALKQMMRDLGLNLCRSDGDVWMRLDVDTYYLGEKNNY